MPQRTIDWDMVTVSAMPSFIKKLHDNFFVGDVLMQELKPQVKVKELGKFVTIPIREAGEFTEWYAGTDTHDTIIRNYATAATFSPCNQITSVAIDEEEELQADVSDAKVLEMLSDKMEGAEDSSRENLGIQIYNAGTNSRVITGLQYALPISTLAYLDTSQTYLGLSCGGVAISSDRYGYWQPNVDASGTTPWTCGSGGTFMFAKPNPMAKMFNKIGGRTNRQPNLIVSGWASWTDFEASLAALQTYQRPLQKTSLAQSGFTSLMYRNAAWVPDARAPRAGNQETVFVIDKNALKLYWDPRRRFHHTKWFQPHNQSVRVMYIKNRLQLAFNERRTSGAMLVDVTAIG